MRDSVVWEKCVRLWVCTEMDMQRGKKELQRSDFHHVQSWCSRVRVLVLWCGEALLTKGAGLERRVGPGCRQISMATVIRLCRSLRGPGTYSGSIF